MQRRVGGDFRQGIGAGIAEFGQHRAGGIEVGGRVRRGERRVVAVDPVDGGLGRVVVLTLAVAAPAALHQ